MTLLNQTHSRPICYVYAQELVSSIPDKWKVARDEAIVDFKNTIPKIKEFVTNKITNLHTAEELAVLKKHELTTDESCFWFTDRENRDKRGNLQTDDDRSLYAEFDCNKVGETYRNEPEIGKLRAEDLIAIYFNDMVADGVDVMRYLFLTEWSKKEEGYHYEMYDYNRKKVSRWGTEFERLENKIKAYGQKFYEENDLSMSFTMPYSRNSCHQRAQLVTPEEYNILYSWHDKLEVIHLKWHKQKETLKNMFMAYVEFIRNSKTLEKLIEKDPAFENCRHKIEGTGTALSLSSINSSLIDECIAKRQLADTVAVVVTPKESVG